MKNIALIAGLLSLFLGASAMAAAASLPIIPAPQQWRPAAGTLEIGSIRHVVAVGDSAWTATASLAARWLAPVLPHELELRDSAATPPGGLRLLQDQALQDEAYRLEMGFAGVVLSAGTEAGVFRGLMSLVQLGLHDTTLPCGQVLDSPRFGWRGMLLDCGRHYMPLPVIKEVLDALALHKFNVLHWHLTEDQGWRLEVPGLPGLTDTSAWRTDLTGQRTGGFYTAAEVREIVAYAAERHIEVVPEIEMPGHTVAVLTAYPELSCTGGPFAVETQWGIHSDIFCAGNDAVFAFLETVLDHVITLFPSPYIHLGGDEAPKDRWQKCERCQARMRQEGLATEAELQSWFIGRMEKYLTARGRKIIGWDEILEGGLVEKSGGATIQSWRGTEGAIAAARAGHDAIASPTSHAYFDYDPGVLDVQQVYGFDPVPAELSAEEAGHILGGEMNLWTEYIPPERVPRMLAPRLAAMAEALWTGSRKGGFPEFLGRLEEHAPVWDHLKWVPGAAARPVTIRTAYDGKQNHRELRFEIDERLREEFAASDLVIRRRAFSRGDFSAYRPDIWPDEQPPLVVDIQAEVAPPQLSQNGQRGQVAVLHLAQLFVRDQAYGAPALVEWNPHLGLGHEVSLVHAASSRYPGGDVGWLVDGQHGGPSFRDEQWAGFEGVNLEAVVDLGQVQDLSHLSVRFLQDANAWIFLPTAVHFSLSNDGQSWHEFASLNHDLSDKEQQKAIREFAVSATEHQARYVRVVALNRAVCPDWHPGKGLPCWVFADELVIR